jgi:hypothetical protein
MMDEVKRARFLDAVSAKISERTGIPKEEINWRPGWSLTIQLPPDSTLLAGGPERQDSGDEDSGEIVFGEWETFTIPPDAVARFLERLPPLDGPESHTGLESLNRMLEPRPAL